MKTIAIAIANPGRVAREFGEVAGDCAGEKFRWWVGTHRELTPAASLPAGARVIGAPVSFCGGDAWIAHAPRPAQAQDGACWASPLGWSRMVWSRLVAGQVAGQAITPARVARAGANARALTPPPPRLP